MADRDLRVITFAPTERFRVLPPIANGRSATETLREINDAVRPVVRTIQRRQRRRVLVHKHGLALGLLAFAVEQAGSALAALARKWGSK